MYDVVIIGTGPAGYTAGIYSARYNMKTLIIGKEKGGAITGANSIENWPGDNKVSGIALMDKIDKHAKTLGVEVKTDNVTQLAKKGKTFLISTDKGKFEAKTLILAMGTARRNLNVSGEKELSGKGVSYCFTCDAPFFRDKEVIVVGAGDSGAMACILLSQYAKKIHWLVRSKVRANPSHIASVKKLGKTEEIKGEIKEIYGKKFVEGVKFKDGKDLKVQGVFVEIGATPSTVLCKEIGVKIDDLGYIVVDKEQETNVKGVFAAGDICEGIFKQMTVAVGHGAISALGVYNYVKGGK